MATAPVIRKKNAVYQQNAAKRTVKSSLKEQGLKLPIPYWMFGILVFALVGGALLQVIKLFVSF